jgi:hypothetical protein
MRIEKNIHPSQIYNSPPSAVHGTIPLLLSSPLLQALKFVLALFDVAVLVFPNRQAGGLLHVAHQFSKFSSHSQVTLALATRLDLGRKLAY